MSDESKKLKLAGPGRTDDGQPGETGATRNLFKAPGPKRTGRDFQAAPDKIETQFGTLEFIGGGFPTKETSEKIFDEMALQRVTQAYMVFLPAISIYAIVKDRSAILASRPRRISGSWQIS